MVKTAVTPENSMLFIDTETDSINPQVAKLKWFGAYSTKDNKFYLLDYNSKDKIRELINTHKYITGFNNKNYDHKVIENYFKDGEIFKFKIIVDLYEISAPKGNGNYGKHNKNRLVQMGFKLKNYKLKTIIESLKLDNMSKGDINYNIFKKDKWNAEEIKEIEKYLKQDIVITKKLFEWYEEQFNPLKELLPSEAQRKLIHIRAGLSSLGYQIICNKSGLPDEWEETKPKNHISFSGGHHIEHRKILVKGNIVSIDFTSAYPHALIMCNLFSPQDKGWSGKDYYKVEGFYNNKEIGKIEAALKYIFLERLKAKRNNDKPKNLSYKIIINSIYGMTGNYRFKSLYNPITASNCTSIVRTWLKKLSKTLEENGFEIIYGFTDNVYLRIPEESNKEELMFVVDKFIQEIKDSVPFPMETFGMELEEELKMIWFAAKNCYLYVTKNDEVKYKSTLLNANTPEIIKNVFDGYMSSKIIKELDVNFNQEELEKQIKEELKKDVKLSAQEYNVSDLKSYNSKTSLYYQISERYGEGKHFLILNLKGIGVGKVKKYCTLEEFNQSKLNYEDVDLTELIKHLKPFYSK